MNDQECREWGGGLFKALRARSAKATDNLTVQGTMWSKRTGGRSTGVAAVMDSGCTHPITTKTVTTGMGMTITPLTRELEIVEASGASLRILGTVKMYLECEYWEEGN